MPPLLLLAATEIISGRTERSERCASRDGEVTKPTTTLLQQVLCARLENQQAGEFSFFGVFQQRAKKRFFWTDTTSQSALSRVLTVAPL
jgi:hypothetical protein